MQQAPKQDLELLEQHRQEARKYLPPTEAEYQQDIEEGTDPYLAAWWIAGVLALAAVAVLIDIAVSHGWTGV